MSSKQRKQSNRPQNQPGPPSRKKEASEQQQFGKEQISATTQKQLDTESKEGEDVSKGAVTQQTSNQQQEPRVGEGETDRGERGGEQELGEGVGPKKDRDERLAGAEAALNGNEQGKMSTGQGKEPRDEELRDEELRDEELRDEELRDKVLRDKELRGEEEPRGEEESRGKEESRGDEEPRGEEESRGDEEPRGEEESRGDEEPRDEEESRGEVESRGAEESRGEEKRAEELLGEEKRMPSGTSLERGQDSQEVRKDKKDRESMEANEKKNLKQSGAKPTRQPGTSTQGKDEEELKEGEKPTASVAEYLSGKMKLEEDKTPKDKLLEKIQGERKDEGKEHHNLLLNFVGEWNAQCTFAAPAMGCAERGEALMTCHSLYEGKFIEMSFKHKMKEDFEYRGKGVFSYSPHQNEFQSVWFDSTSSSIHASRGECLKSGKEGFELKSFGPFPDFFSGKNKETRQTYEFDGKDCITYKAYDLVEGEDEEKQTMSVVYTRASGKRQ